MTQFILAFSWDKDCSTFFFPALSLSNIYHISQVNFVFDLSFIMHIIFLFFFCRKSILLHVRVSLLRSPNIKLDRKIYR